MRKFGLRQRLCGSAAVLAVTGAGLIAAPAYAQNTDAVSDDSGGIVVTAQRREEKAKDVPIALTTITAEKLGQGDVQQLSDISKLTPALRFDNYGGFVQPTIRGVGTAVSASGAGSNVGIYIDGFYAPNPLSADFQLLSVESVTVLKGPQGTLFGRNSTGGAIQVTTSDPSHDAHGVAEVSYGRFNSQKYQAYVTGGLSDTVAVDLAGLYRKGNGYIRNITTGNAKDGAYEDWSVRAGLKLDVSDSASFLLRYTHADTNDPNPNTANAYVDDAGRIYSFGAVLPPAFGVKTATNPREVSNNGRTDFTSKVDAFQLTGEFDLGFAKLTSYTQFRDESSYSALDLDGTSLSVFDVEFFITDKIFTQEFVLASQGAGRLKWSAGAFFFSDKNIYHYLNGSIQGAPFARISSTGTDTTGIAVFADGTYELADKLFLGVGARYGQDKIKNGFFDTTVLAGTPTTGRTNVPEVSKGSFTPRVTLRYEPTPSSSIYASFSRGYKAPILNVAGYSTNTINAEHLSAFEVGYKYAARGLSFDASAYYYKYNDLQVASYIGTQSLLTNAANSRVKGVEAQLAYEVTPNFSFSLAGAYLDAKYDTFKGSPFYSQCLDPVLCGAGYGLFANQNVDASGFRMARSPKFTGSAGARYRTKLAGGELGLSGTLSYTSRAYFDTVQQFSQKGYELLSLRAEWTDPSDRFTLAVFGDNITNAKYRSQILPGPFAIQTTWGSPTTYGGSVRVKF